MAREKAGQGVREGEVVGMSRVRAGFGRWQSKAGKKEGLGIRQGDREGSAVEETGQVRRQATGGGRAEEAGQGRMQCSGGERQGKGAAKAEE
jgi:hypothetical protein